MDMNSRSQQVFNTHWKNRNDAAKHYPVIAVLGLTDYPQPTEDDLQSEEWHRCDFITVLHHELTQTGRISKRARIPFKKWYMNLAQCFHCSRVGSPRLIHRITDRGPLILGIWDAPYCCECRAPLEGKVRAWRAFNEAISLHRSINDFLASKSNLKGAYSNEKCN